MFSVFHPFIRSVYSIVYSIRLFHPFIPSVYSICYPFSSKPLFRAMHLTWGFSSIWGRWRNPQLPSRGQLGKWPLIRERGRDLEVKITAGQRGEKALVKFLVPRRGGPNRGQR